MFIEKIRNAVSPLLRGRRKYVTAAVAFSLVFCLLTSFVVLRLNNVTVMDGGEEVASFTTFASERDELLAAADVKVDASDIVRQTKEGRNITLEITRTVEVSVKTGEDNVILQIAEGKTVEDALEMAKVEYDESDKLSHKLTDVLSADMEIEVIRCATKIIKETEIIPFKSETKESDTLYVGTTSTAQKGKNGEITKTYEVVYENGKQVDKKLISKETTKEVQNEIILKGTKVKAPASFGAKMSKAELAGAKLINVTATAYCNTSDGGQITALGNKTGFGIVAVDPRVIPLGSKLYITSADGSYVYGYCIAGDTGGAIKGNRVDLFLGSESECQAFGRRPMQVYVLG